jgi:hypothetical protein
VSGGGEPATRWRGGAERERGRGREGSGEQSEAGWRPGGKWRDEMAGNI